MFGIKKTKGDKNNSIDHLCFTIIELSRFEHFAPVIKIFAAREYSPKEILRLQFCFLILNLSLSICWINEIEWHRNQSQAIKIINNMFNRFFEIINDIEEKEMSIVKIRDYIVDDDEIVIICNNVGVSSTYEHSSTGFYDLLTHTYNNRVSQYKEAFQERMRIAYEKRKGVMGDPVAILFVKHFIGKRDIILGVEFSMIIQNIEKILIDEIRSSL
jgi:hypothetical protein